MTGVSRDANGVKHYDGLPATLLEMLAEQVDSRVRRGRHVRVERRDQLGGAAARSADRGPAHQPLQLLTPLTVRPPPAQRPRSRQFDRGLEKIRR